MTVVRYADDGPTADGPVEVAPGASLERELQPGESSQAVSVRWTGGPTVATWRVDGERTAAAPCAAGPSERWHTSTLLRLWTVVATPAEDWRGPETRPAVRRDPGLATAPLRPAPTPEPGAPPASGDVAPVPETATVPVGPGPTDALTAQPQEPDPDA